MNIAIIGAGFSGTMCAVNLARISSTPLKIYLIDKKDAARGAAYAKSDECFLLNVRADQMGAFAENPNHFFEWLNQKNISASPRDFLSRSLYGDYLKSILEQTQKEHLSSIEFISDEVIDIDPQTKTVHCRNIQLKAEAVILASGLNAPELLLDTLAESQEPLTIIGTGLSMVDAVVYLEKHNYRGKITAVSRHGRLPAEHKFFPDTTPRPKYDFSTGHSLLHVLSVIKADLPRYEWRLVIDALRPHNQFLWSHWSRKEKSQFLRYCRSLWDVHRHRMSPLHMDLLKKLMNEGRLEIRAVGYGPFTPATKKVIELKGLTLNERQNSLWENLTKRKLIQKDELGLGIESSPDGCVFNNWLFTLGPLRRGQLWECTAVPEIRKQARELAERILG